MPQNIYDNPEFFAGYDRLRTEKAGLNDALEQPAMRSLLPDVRGRRVLDLGCGAGGLSHWLVEHGAVSVVGADVSERMLGKARSNPHPQITFIHGAAEDLDFPAASFDLAVSSLMFHYIEDLASLFANIRSWLVDGGLLIFSMEHPFCTAGQGIIPGWEKDSSGENTAWRLDRYSDEGKRVSRWFVDGVVKYHRRVSTILNALVESGFRVNRLLEPYATPEAEMARTDLLDERRRPAFLFVAAQAA